VGISTKLAAEYKYIKFVYHYLSSLL